LTRVECFFMIRHETLGTQIDEWDLSPLDFDPIKSYFSISCVI